MSSLAPDANALLCVSCGARNVENARYCNQCGLTLAQTWGAPTLTLSSPPVSVPLSTRSLGTASTRPPPPPGPASTRPAPPALLERATDARELADPLLGVVVAERYRIKEQIGRGGMGVVYRVEHARIGKLMALKLLTGELTRDPQQVARFKREAQLVSRLSHPNTVQVFDFGASDGLVYLAMEFLKGEDLGHLIRRVGPLGVERTLKIVIQICSSLGEAHEKGMVHRDLKPENIIVMQGEEEDLIKVLDFGLAKLREGGELSEVTSRGAIVGTPYYMSPEQIRGDDVGSESDVYSLGALTYACLTGTVVFDANTPMGVLTKHLTELPESPSRRFPDLLIPTSVSQVVMSTLEKDPKRRMPSVVELQQALILELEHAGTPEQVERLLNFSRLRHATDAAEIDGGAATRDEVERYERKLRQRGRAVWAVLGLALAGAGALGYREFQRWSAPPVFSGDELEPNDAASAATRVPFPFVAKGIIGKRLDPERSDRDFYRFRVPGSAPVSFEASAVPGLAWCGLLYAVGSEEPLGRYCPGSAEHTLKIDALRLPAGEYVLGLMQDREAYTKDAAPPTFESISATYRLNVAAQTAPDVEVEPNDFPRDANLVGLGEKRAGRLSWMRDVDYFCSSAQQKVRLRVSDAPEHPRAHAAVLQVTPLAGDSADVPVRVHRSGSRDIPPSARDVVGDFQSTSMDPAAGRPVCVQLTLVPNPWAPTPHPLVAPAGEEPYWVEVVPAP